MKVLVLLNRLDTGGIETTLLASLGQFIKHGVTVHILCSKGGSLDKMFIEAGAVLHYHDKNGYNPFSQLFLLYKLLRNEKFDVVHSRDGHTSGFLAVVCKLCSVPMVISIHSSTPNFRRAWQNQFILNYVRALYLIIHKVLTLNFATIIVGHSKANLSYYTATNPDSEKYRVVYNGINFSRLYNIESDSINSFVKFNDFISNADKVFMHVGSFRKQKNHDFLIDLFNELCPKENNYRLILLGEGPLLAEIKHKVESLQLSELVYFGGLVQDVNYYFENSDIFIFPSLNEGFGNVLLEAQFKKLVISASSIEPHYESCYEEYHSYFYNPKKLSEAKSQLIKIIDALDGNEMDDILAEAQSFSSRFSIENMVCNIIQVYREC